jgi:hypothetical protein
VAAAASLQDIKQEKSSVIVEVPGKCRVILFRLPLSSPALSCKLRLCIGSQDWGQTGTAEIVCGSRYTPHRMDVHTPFGSRIRMDLQTQGTARGNSPLQQPGESTATATTNFMVAVDNEFFNRAATTNFSTIKPISSVEEAGK